jgi:hypothetical protein
MMDLLRANPWLKEIDLTNTPLERDGHAVQVKAQLEMNSRDYMAVVKGMRRVHRSSQECSYVVTHTQVSA